MKIIVDGDSIAEAMQEFQTQLFQMSIGRKRSALASVLAVEEVLLFYRDKIKDFKASVEVIRDIRHFAVCITVPGNPFSSKNIKDEGTPGILDGILRNSDITMDYTYKKGCNYITLIVEKYAPLWDNLMFTLRFMGESRKHLLSCTVVLVISMLTNFCIPLLTAKLIVQFTENNFVRLLAVSGGILAARVVYSLSLGAGNIYYNKVFFRVRANLETNLSEKILSVKEEVFDEKGTGPFISRITDDLVFISKGLATMVDQSVRCMHFIGAFLATLILDVRIFLCELVTLGLLAFVEYIRSSNYDSDSRSVIEAEEKRAGLITDVINGESDIKLLGSINYFRDRMEQLANKAEERNLHRIVRSRIGRSTGEIVTAVCYFGTTVLMGYYLYSGEYDIAKTLVLFSYFNEIGVAFIELIHQVVEFNRNFNLSCERVRNLQEGTEFPKESYGTVHIPNVRGEITLEQVTFAYNHENILEKDRNIIKSLSLSVKPGETIALVGKSGSGKSTLLRLISKQRTCSSGRILIDGTNINDIDQETLRENMMTVSQSPYFFNTSIKENLLISKPDATMKELKQVCETACILEDIEKMPDGFNTILGERGTRMSGGQKQRLAIARGLLKGTKIILLDEATSAIDNMTQKRIKKVLEELHGGCTVVMIAHRLSTIVDADRIVLIDDGRILAQGTHAELLQNCVAYRELYNAE